MVDSKPSKLETNLDKLQRLLAFMEEGAITKEDFLKAFETVAKTVGEEKKKLADLAERLTEAVTNAERSLNEKTDAYASSVKQELVTSLTEELSKSSTSLAQLVARVEEKLASVRDGIDADEERVINEVLSRIKLPEYRAPIMDGPEEIATKLDLLDEENQLAAIKALKAEIEELKKRPVRSGGTSAMGVAQAMKYVVKRQTPTGTIDGVNATFTVSSAPYAVLSIVINGEFIPLSGNYTIAGKTITFSSAIPASYSGKDFEIVYV